MGDGLLAAWFVGAQTEANSAIFNSLDSDFEPAGGKE